MDKKKIKKFLKKHKTRILLAILATVLIALLAWGYYGGQEAKRVTQVCDIGIGKGHVLCWKWRQGTDNEILDNLFGENPKFLDSLKNWKTGS